MKTLTIISVTVVTGIAIATTWISLSDILRAPRGGSQVRSIQGELHRRLNELSGMGSESLESRDYLTAISQFEELCQLQPRNPIWAANLALAYKGVGKESSAYASLKTAMLGMQESQTNIRSDPIWLCLLGDLAANQGETGIAKLAYHAALGGEMGPLRVLRATGPVTHMDLVRSRVRAYISASVACTKTGRREEALEFSSRALAIDGDNVEALTSKGRALLALGNRREAGVCYQRAEQLSTGSKRVELRKLRTQLGLLEETTSLRIIDGKPVIDRSKTQQAEEPVMRGR